jgi:hypothetical protein
MSWVFDMTIQQTVGPRFVSMLVVLILGLSSNLSRPDAAMAQGSEPSQVGTSMANFLKIGVGARAAGMGNAFVAVADDASTLYWNPGGIAMLEQGEISIGTTNWVLDTRLYFFGGTLDLGNVGVLGLSVNRFDSGDIEETTVYQPDGTGRTFNASNMAVGLTYSRQMTDRFGAGITIKYVSESLDRTNASAIAIDVGSLFVTDFLNNMRIGFNLSNLGSQMRLTGSDLLIQVPQDLGTKFVPADMATETWDLPLLFRFGIATDVFSGSMQRLTVAADVLDSRDYRYRIHTGGEWSFREILFLRGGYKFNYDDGNLSLGAGLQLPDLDGFGVRFDYSYESLEFLEDVQRISLRLTY